MEIEDTTHNGWTNYATWLVNLEMFYGYELTEDKSLVDLEQELRYSALSYIDETVPDNTLVCSWARAFIHQVDFFKIASVIIQNRADNLPKSAYKRRKNLQERSNNE
jgi:hypothetical protein